MSPSRISSPSSCRATWLHSSAKRSPCDWSWNIRARELSPRWRSLTAYRGIAAGSLPSHRGAGCACPPYPRGPPPRPLRGEKLRLLVSDFPRERAVGADHAPPGNVVEDVERPHHRARSPGLACPQRHLGIGQRPSARDRAHDLFDGLHERAVISLPHGTRQAVAYQPVRSPVPPLVGYAMGAVAAFGLALAFAFVCVDHPVEWAEGRVFDTARLI